MKSYLRILSLILHPTLQLTVTSFEKSWFELGAKFSCVTRIPHFVGKGGRGKGKDKVEGKRGETEASKPFLVSSGFGKKYSKLCPLHKTYSL